MTYLLGLFLIILVGIFNYSTMGNYMNGHALWIVLGGTLIIWLLLAPTHVIKNLLSFFKLSLKDEKSYNKELEQLANNQFAQISDPYGVIALARDMWDLGVDTQEFERVLRYKVEKMVQENGAAISSIQNLGKYPPALGMIGTILGMVNLFMGLGGTIEQSQIGYNLALAMTATLYGLILTNFVIFPLVDRLEANREIRLHNIDETLKILFTHNKKNTEMITEVMLRAI